MIDMLRPVVRELRGIILCEISCFVSEMKTSAHCVLSITAVFFNFRMKELYSVIIILLTVCSARNFTSHLNFARHFSCRMMLF